MKKRVVKKMRIQKINFDQINIIYILHIIKGFLNPEKKKKKIK